MTRVSPASLNKGHDSRPILLPIRNSGEGEGFFENLGRFKRGEVA